MLSYKTGQRKIIMDYLVNHENEFVNAEEILEYMKKNKTSNKYHMYIFIRIFII